MICGKMLTTGEAGAKWWFTSLPSRRPPESKR
nr:MAG TPA: hypothetical protein [Caudoviricetes sp.]